MPRMCNACQETKDDVAFRKRVSPEGKVYLYSYCKVCAKARALVYYQNEKNKKGLEHFRKKNKKQYDKDPNPFIEKATKRQHALKTRVFSDELTNLVFSEALCLAKLRKKIFGFAWDVDHIIPLQAKNCCGLHIWSNLQVIPATVNRSKGNKCEVTDAKSQS